MLTEEKYHNGSNNYGQLLHYNCHDIKFSLRPHEAYRRNYAVVGGVNLILAPVSFILNLTILIAFSKVNATNNITNLIFRSLCTADMLTGLFAQPAFAAFYLIAFQKHISCSLIYISTAFSFFFVAVSFLSLLAIHIERYLAVFYPFKHHIIKTKTILIKKLILTGWILTAILVSLCLLTPRFIMFAVFSVVLIPTVFMWSCYVQVKIVREVNRRTKPFGKDVPQVGDRKDEREYRFNYVDSRANRISGLILMAYAVCYIPVVVIYTWLHFNKRLYFLRAEQYWAETLVYLNSIFNPLLFSLQKKDIRQIIASSVRSLVPCSRAT